MLFWHPCQAPEEPLTRPERRCSALRASQAVPGPTTMPPVRHGNGRPVVQRTNQPRAATLHPSRGGSRGYDEHWRQEMLAAHAAGQPVTAFVTASLAGMGGGVVFIFNFFNFLIFLIF